MKNLNITFVLSRLDQTGMTTNTIDLIEGLKTIEPSLNINLVLGQPNLGVPAMQRHYARLSDNCTITPPATSNKSSTYIAARMIWQLARIKSDIIHVESPYCSFMPWLLHKPFVSTFHVCEIHPCFKYKNATHLIAISEETRSYAIEHHGYLPENITLVRHGVSKRFAEKLTVEQQDAIKSRYGIPVDKIIVGLVGSVEPRKGHHRLLGALDLLEDSIRKKIHVVFCGSYKGTNDGYLENAIDSSSVKDKITWIQYCDPKDIYAIMDICCLPSDLEGFPLTPIESMMSGVATVRSNCQGASDQIISGLDGFLHEIDDINGLSKIIGALIENPSLRASIAKKGQEKAMQEFSSEAMARNTLRVYENLLSRKS